jgi:hypothetical protein
VNGCAARPCRRSCIPIIGPVGMLWICCGQRGRGASVPRLKPVNITRKSNAAGMRV